MTLIYRVHEITSAGHHFYTDYKTRKAARRAFERTLPNGSFTRLSAYESKRWIKRNGMQFETYTNYIPAYQL